MSEKTYSATEGFMKVVVFQSAVVEQMMRDKGIPIPAAISTTDAR